MAGNYYQAEVHITKQEDGLWRLYVPEMKGAWVDCRTLEEGFSDIQEAIALAIGYYLEHGWTLPKSIRVEKGDSPKAILPILIEEYQFASPTTGTRRSKKR